MVSQSFIVGIARVCHEVNSAICTVFEHDVPPRWDEAPDWQKESAIKGVEFALTNPSATPEDQHNAWMKDKLENGWVYGPLKDTKAKTHPCLVPYVDLPPSQRMKDHIFRAVVRGMVR